MAAALLTPRCYSFSSTRSLIRFTVSVGSMSNSISLPVSVFTLICILEVETLNRSNHLDHCEKERGGAADVKQVFDTITRPSNQNTDVTNSLKTKGYPFHRRWHLSQDAPNRKRNGSMVFPPLRPIPKQITTTIVTTCNLAGGFNGGADRPGLDGGRLRIDVDLRNGDAESKGFDHGFDLGVNYAKQKYREALLSFHLEPGSRFSCITAHWF